MGARRRCCCGCEVFYDEFSRSGPAVENDWDETNATGTWGITDTSLWETSGTGEIIHSGRIQENQDGYGVSYDIYDEVAGNVYRIIFGAKASHAGADCLIAEYEVGETIDDDDDGQPDYTSAIRIYSRVSSVETLIAEKYIPPAAVDANGGRRFYAWLHNFYDEGTFCVWIGTSAYPSLLVTTGQTIQDRYFGAANATGAEPINIDNFEIELATYENVNGARQPCFWCTCRCLKFQDDNTLQELLDDQPFPGVLHLRIVGGCAYAVDETIDLEFDADYPTVGANQWVNHSDFTLCGTPFQFRAECSGDGRLTLYMYYTPSGYPPGTWFPLLYCDTSPRCGSVSLMWISHTCTPIEEVYLLTLNSLNGFPCCGPMNTGSFTITLTG
jgi:hypothetical protein